MTIDRGLWAEGRGAGRQKGRRAEGQGGAGRGREGQGGAGRGREGATEGAGRQRGGQRGREAGRGRGGQGGRAGKSLEKSRASGKSLQKVPKRLFRDFFQTLEGPLGPEGARDFFQIFSGFWALRARETLANGIFTPPTETIT